MIKQVSTKTETEVGIDGVGLQFKLEDGCLRAVVLTDRVTRRTAVIQVAEAHNRTLQVLVPQPPERVQRWFVTGDLLGLTKVDESFEHHHEAIDRLREYSRTTGRYDADLGLEVVEREVELPELALKSTESVEVPF